MRAIRAVLTTALLLGSALRALAIVGPSSDGSAYAAHVVMVLNRLGSSAGFCTAVVVAPDAVLTAAHCVAGLDGTRVHFRDEEGKPVLLPIIGIAVHPGYRAAAIKLRERSIDLALLRLSKPLPPRFTPAVLAGEHRIGIGERVRIAGFGIAAESGSDRGGTLRLATLAARAPLSSILLWAEDPTGAGAGACRGDSGAPIFAADEAVVIAVTSWAAGGSGGRCGVLTQGALVSPQRQWIDTTLAAWESR